MPAKIATGKSTTVIRNPQERQHARQQKEYTASRKPTYEDSFKLWNELSPGAAWITSPRGSNPVTLEVVAGSFLAETLKASHQTIGFGSRIVGNAIKENVAGRYEPERIIAHGGPVDTILFSIPLPTKA